MCVNTFTQLFNTSINRSETISDTGNNSAWYPQ